MSGTRTMQYFPLGWESPKIKCSKINQGGKVASEPRYQIHVWAEIHWFFQPCPFHTVTASFSFCFPQDRPFLQQHLSFSISISAIKKKRALSEMRSQEFWPRTGCTSLTVIAIPNLLLALGRTRQISCCTKLSGISHRSGCFQSFLGNSASQFSLE